MSHREPSFTVNVDTTNPGQVIACCGLLELAHRLWPGAEGWFERSQFVVTAPDTRTDSALACLVKELVHCDITGLSEAERKERDDLERRGRDLRNRGERLSYDEQKRRQELGERARKGTILIGEPFDFILDWWNADDEAVPKTWAGQQELHKIARAAQDALSGIDEPGMTTLLDFSSVLREPTEYRKGKSGHKAVEPFYFDARRFAHRLDVGFSLDALGLETTAHPAVELLGLIGLQRFRPAATPEQRWTFDYWTWSSPLGAPVAAAIFSGVSPIPGRQRYRFRLRFRDDQKRYKAFGPVTLIGGES